MKFNTVRESKVYYSAWHKCSHKVLKTMIRKEIEPAIIRYMSELLEHDYDKYEDMLDKKFPGKTYSGRDMQESAAEIFSVKDNEVEKE